MILVDDQVLTDAAALGGDGHREEFQRGENHRDVRVRQIYEGASDRQPRAMAGILRNSGKDHDR